MPKGFARAQVLVNAGQANAATGDAGYQDCLASADCVASALGISADEARRPVIDLICTTSSADAVGSTGGCSPLLPAPAIFAERRRPCCACLFSTFSLSATQSLSILIWTCLCSSTWLCREVCRCRKVTQERACASAGGDARRGARAGPAALHRRDRAAHQAGRAAGLRAEAGGRTGRRRRGRAPRGGRCDDDRPGQQERGAGGAAPPHRVTVRAKQHARRAAAAPTSTDVVSESAALEARRLGQGRGPWHSSSSAGSSAAGGARTASLPQGPTHSH